MKDKFLSIMPLLFFNRFSSFFLTPSEHKFRKMKSPEENTCFRLPQENSSRRKYEKKELRNASGGPQV